MGSRSLGTLTVDLLAKTGLLEQGLDKGARSVQKFARDVDKQASAVEAIFGKAFKAVGIAAGAAFGAATLAIENQIDAMIELGVQAKQVAMPIKDFTAFSAVANDAEVDTDTFTNSLVQFSRAVAMAQEGSKRYAAAFKAIGIDPKSIKDTKDGLLSTFDALNKYRDSVGKTAVEQQLLGQTGTRMAALIAQGSDAIRDQMKAMDALGVSYDENGAKKVAAYDDAMDAFHETLTGLARTVTIDLLPALTDGIKTVTGFIQAWNANGGLKNAIEDVKALLSHLDEIAVFFAARFAVANAIGAFIALGNAVKVAGIAVGVLRVGMAALGGPVGIVATAIAGLATWYVESSKGSTDLANSTDQLSKAMQTLHGLSGQAQQDARAEAIENIKAALAIQQRVKAEIDRYDAMQKLSQQTPDTISIGPAGAMGGSIAAVTTGVDAKRVENLRKQYEASRKAVSDLLIEIEKPIRQAQAATSTNKPTITLLDPNAATKAAQAAQKLRDSYDALFKASSQYANSVNPDPLAAANAAMAEGVANLAKLKDAYIQAGGSAQIANRLFDKGLQGLKDKFTFDLEQPKRELDAYTGSLRDQLNALKASNEAKLQGLTLGEHAAQNAQELAQATQDATKAITDFVQAHQLHPEAMSEDMYQKELAALKAYFAERNKLIQQNQAAENAMRADMGAGWQKGIADFIEDTQNRFQQGQQLAQSFTTGFADAFEKFASGAESAKKAFGDFIDDLFAQALRFVANQALAKLFNAFGNDGQTGTAGGSGGGWAGLFSAFAGMFGGGRAYGGPVAAGGLYEVNERGMPEMLAVGGRQFLMMGPQAGTVEPVSRSRAPGGTTINVAVQPTSTRRTADQVATAVARQQRIATMRNG